MLTNDLHALLPADHRRALVDAIRMLIEEAVIDLGSRTRRGRLEGAFLEGFLPRKYSHRYSVRFASRFLACLYSVAWKLYSPDREMLACVGEELALNAIIRLAEALLEERGHSADFTALYDEAFEDGDFELLFASRWDGIEDTEHGRNVLGMANLHFDDWFKPFRGSYPVHPYIALPRMRRRHPRQREDEESGGC